MDEQHTEQTKRLERDFRELGSRFDRHLEIYATNGKELAKLSAEIAAIKSIVTSYIKRSDLEDSKLVTKDEFAFYKRLSWLIITAVVAQTITLFYTNIL